MLTYCTFFKGIQRYMLLLLQVSHFIVSCRKSLGHLALIELEKENQTLVPNKAWYPAKVDVTSPEGGKYSFPVYRWITNKQATLLQRGSRFVSMLEMNKLKAKNDVAIHLEEIIKIIKIN